MMNAYLKKKLGSTGFLLIAVVFITAAQSPFGGRSLRGLGNSIGNGGQSSDSLQHRDYSEDSVNISYRLLDSAFTYTIDSSIRHFDRRFPPPDDYLFLGNTGSASKSFMFQPDLEPGWDPGFHAYDPYKWKLSDVPLFQTTKPYTEIGYEIAAQREQVIEVMHTQNRKPNWNLQFHYRLINAPGFFQNQSTNHNNYVVTSKYESRKKRYHNTFILLANNLQAAENGGIQDDSYLSDPEAFDRFSIPVKLGNAAAPVRSFFNTTLSTGNKYKELTVLLRQQYDLGRKDSLVTDSTITPLFFPRLRFEHTLTYQTGDYLFLDKKADSAYYQDIYKYPISSANKTVSLRDQWQSIENDFSIYQFPDDKNLKQYIRLGATLQNLKGYMADSLQIVDNHVSYFNIIGHAEYRNRTRNNKWDMELSGRLFLAGYYVGDYHAIGKLRRYIGKANETLAEIGAENANVSPDYTFNGNSAFYLDVDKNFNKQNTTHLYAAIRQDKYAFGLRADYYLVSNFLYLSNYYELQQQTALFNLLRIRANKRIRVGKHWNWYLDLAIQQPTGTAPVNVPLVFGTTRFAFEGQFFRNLNISTGLQARYHTPYNADGYSPLLGRFFVQNTEQINNYPDIDAFVHFRIRSFKAYFRVENLNTVEFNGPYGFGFTNNNLAAPNYPYPGMVIRLGIWWNFVN